MPSLIIEFPDEETRKAFEGLWLDGGMAEPFFQDFENLEEDWIL